MRHSTSLSDRRGFTVLELMLALTLGASLLLAGRVIFERIGETGQTAVQAAAEIDAERAQYDQLRTPLRNVGAEPDTGARFVGDEHHVQFGSWCLNGTTVWARCVVVITVDTDVVINFGGGSRVVPSGRGVHGTLRYLADAHHGGLWRATWGDTLGTPPAIAVVFGTDTTVLRTGTRE